MCTRNLYWSRVRNCSSQYEPLDIIVHEFNPRGHNSKCRHWRSLENMTCYSLHKQTVPWNPFFSLAAVTEFLHSSTPGIKSLTFWPGPHSCIFFRLFFFLELYSMNCFEAWCKQAVNNLDSLERYSRIKNTIFTLVRNIFCQPSPSGGWKWDEDLVVYPQGFE